MWIVVVFLLIFKQWEENFLMQDFFFLGDAARETLHGLVKAEKRNIVLKIGHKLYLFKAGTENIMLKNGHKLYLVKAETENIMLENGHKLYKVI